MMPVTELQTIYSFFGESPPTTFTTFEAAPSMDTLGKANSFPGKKKVSRTRSGSPEKEKAGTGNGENEGGEKEDDGYPFLSFVPLRESLSLH